MEKLEFWDCELTFGRRAIMKPGSFYTLEELKENMAKYGIEKGFVYHSLAKEYNLKLGNQKLIDQIKEEPSLEPVWVIMPNYTGEFYSPEELLEKMKENNVKLLAMYPSKADNSFSPAEWSCGELYNQLEKNKIPLILSKKGVEFDHLYAIGVNHPDLKIILTDYTYRIDRYLYPLLSKNKNLHLMSRCHKPHRGIEDICQRFGAERLIFGSGMPQLSGGSAITMLNYALISDKEKKMIAHENLEKMLEEVEYA